MLEAQLSWRPHLERESDILEFLQRTEKHDVGCVVEATTKVKGY
jgi:hypothetical protein